MSGQPRPSSLAGVNEDGTLAYNLRSVTVLGMKLWECPLCFALVIADALPGHVEAAHNLDMTVTSTRLGRTGNEVSRREPACRMPRMREDEVSDESTGETGRETAHRHPGEQVPGVQVR